MRPSVTRLTLRGAKRLVSGPASTRVVTSRALSRNFCSSNAVSADANKKPEDHERKDPEGAAAADAGIEAPAPEMEILTEEVVAASGEVDGKAASAAEGDSEAGDVKVAGEGEAVEGETVIESTDAGVEELEKSTEGEEDVRRGTRSSAARGKLTQTSEELLSNLKELLNDNSVRSALWLYNNALGADGGAAVDMEVLKLMLPMIARSAWGSTARQSINLALDRGYDLGIGMYNCGLHALARGGNGVDVSGVVERLWDLPSASHPNATSYTYLIGAHMYSGHVDSAFDVLKAMKEHLVYPTSSTYHALVTGCLRRRDPRRAYETLMAVEQQRFDISAMTVAQVLVASANNDDHDHVLQLLAKFEETLPRYEDELHRIAEFRSLYRMGSAERTSKEDRASMRGEPNLEIGAFAAVFQCAFRGGRVDIADYAWEMFKKHHSDTDVPPHFWYCMIGAYAGAGRIEEAFNIIGVMRESGFKPGMKDLELALVRPLAYEVTAIDEQYYKLCDRAEGKTAAQSGAADATSQGDDTEAASESPASEETMTDKAAVFEDGSTVADAESSEDTAAKDLSSEPEAASESEVASESEPASDLENAESASEGEAAPKWGEEDSSGAPDSLSSAVLQSDSVPAVSSTVKFEPKSVGIEELNCIIAACSLAHDLDRAFQTYDEVESRFGLTRDVDTYNALLDGCVQTRRLSGGMRVLEEMESVGLPVSGSTVQLASRLMLRAGQIDEVVSLLQGACSRGAVVSLQTFQMVLRHTVRGGHEDAALSLLKLGEESKYSFRALTGRFDYGSVLQLRQMAYGEELPADFEVRPRRNFTRGRDNGGGADMDEDDAMVPDGRS